MNTLSRTELNLIWGKTLFSPKLKTFTIKVNMGEIKNKRKAI